MGPLAVSPHANGKSEEPASQINIEPDLLHGELIPNKQLAPPWSAIMWAHVKKVLVLINSIIDVSIRSNPVVEILSQQELSKHILFVAVAMFNTLLSFHNAAQAPHLLVIRITVILLALGVACLFTSILYRKMAAGVSLLLEMLGFAQVLGAFYILAGWLLPGYYAIFPGACYVICLTPFVLSFWKSSSRVAA